MPPPVVAVVGPTASGKSALALELARELGGEIVNADALQVYRDFDIGTAKPTADERARTPHHLIDILDAHERYSVGAFLERAQGVIPQIAARGRLAIAVGGSGMYVRALGEGLSPMPPIPSEVRLQVRREVAEGGAARAHERLTNLDPAAAERIAVSDRQRIARALEVAVATGKTWSSWLEQGPVEPPFSVVKVGLTVPREVLYDLIEERLHGMVQAGWVREVLGLLKRGYEPSLPAFQAIGYRQLARHHLEGEPLEEALAATLQETRRFAKRQATWFRKEEGVFWCPSGRDHLPTATVLDHLRSVL